MAGRKSLYKSKVEPKLELITAWCRDGMIEKDICLKLNVGVSTFAVYKNNNQELREALKIGKEVADIKVENALYKRALGFEYEEKKQTIQVDGKGKKVKKVETSIKMVIPDTLAQIYWLKNRKPKVWTDRRDSSHNTEANSDIAVSVINKMQKRLEKNAKQDNN